MKNDVLPLYLNDLIQLTRSSKQLKEQHFTERNGTNSQTSCSHIAWEIHQE